MGIGSAFEACLEGQEFAGGAGEAVLECFVEGFAGGASEGEEKLVALAHEDVHFCAKEESGGGFCGEGLSASAGFAGFDFPCGSAADIFLLDECHLPALL